MWEASYEAWICADGTVRIIMRPYSWQEPLCEPEAAWMSQLPNNEDE